MYRLYARQKLETAKKDVREGRIISHEEVFRETSKWFEKWTIRALNDLHDIHEFIAKDSKRYAQIQIENIQNAVSNLLSFPMIGHKIPELHVC